MGLIEAKRYGEALLEFETFLRVRIILQVSSLSGRILASFI
jgi:hypothetical protein